MKIVLCLVFMASSALAANIKMHPLSDEFIDFINSQQSTWKAGRNFDENTPYSQIKKLMGTIRRDPSLKYQPTVHSEAIAIPDTFDARTNWTKCTEVISTIYDQSACGSCWAVATTSAMTDRRCIVSDGQIRHPVSAEDLMSCCNSCGDGCDGGFPAEAWTYWISHGLVTGGKYNSSVGCKPYSLQTCDHHVEGKYVPCSELNYDTPECIKECTVPEVSYEEDLCHGKGQVKWLRSVVDIQREILQFGPVSADFTVYSDFVNYKSGVYQYISGDVEGGHAVRIIGWGTENSVPYWLVANSWNEDWGDNGLFKIRRGHNEVDIENEVYSAIALE